MGTTVITWYVTDDAGNESTCSQVITISDDEKPFVECAENIELNSEEGQCSAHAELISPVSSDNCGVESVSNDHPSEIYPVGVTSVLWTIKDIHGNINTCNQNVTVTDLEIPSITCPSDISVNNDARECSAQITLNSPGTSDNCSVASVISDHASNIYPVGTTTVIWTVSDNHGNSNSCSQQVTVTDNEAPQISCSNNVTISTDSSKAYATLSLREPTVFDNCEEDTVINDHSSPRYMIGTTVVTWIASDIHGNTASCRQTVIVNDTEGPRILCGGAITVNNDPGRCDADVLIHIPNANDNSGHVNLTVDYPDIIIPPFTPSPSTEGNPNARPTVNAIFPVGITILTWTATDSSGNSSSCTQKITVIDNENPSISCASNVSVNNDAGQCSAEVIPEIPAASDNCGIQSITNDHPSNTYPVGSTTVTWTVTDVHINTGTCIQTVTVTDNEKPKIVCPAPVIVNNDNSQCSAAITLTPPSTSDNCGVQQVVSNHLSNIYPVGTTIVTWMVSDAAGNTATCDQTVTVRDATPPSANCKNLTVALDANGNTSIAVPQVNNNSTDNCGIASVTATPTIFNCSNTGANNVTLKVTDINGNVSTCTAVVTVTGGALYQYVMLASDKVHLHHSTVWSGGVGILTANGHADIEQYSTITAPGTFVQATDIDVNSGAQVSTQIHSVAVAPLPAFEANPYTSNNDVTVADNTTVTLTDSLYNTIKIGKYGTVIFTKPVVNVRRIESKEFAVVKFTQCTKVRLKEHLHFKRGSLFNPDGLSVTVFVQKNVEIQEGSKIFANIYANDEHIQVKGKANNRTMMTGLFVAKTFGKGEYTDWYANTQCGKCSLNSSLFARITSSKDVACEGATNGTATVAATGGIAPYTYLWNVTPPQTGTTATNLSPGNYTVTVTDAVGATSITTADIEVHTFTILATDNITIGKSDTVYSGSLGITSATGKITIDQNSSVDDPNSEVIAPNIDVKNGSTATDTVYGVAPVTTLSYEGNITYSSTSDLTVADNSTVTLALSDTLRRNITVGNNATLIFTGGVMNVTNNLVLKKNAKLKFTKCTKVRVKNDLTTDDNAVINSDGLGLTFYVNHNVDFNKGAKVTATVFAPNGSIHTGKATNTTPNMMTGKFIAKTVNGEDWTYWYENTDCPCGLIPGSPFAMREIKNLEVITEPAKEQIVNPITLMSIKAYPNPFSNEIHLKVYTLDVETPIQLKVYNINGEVTESKNDITYDSGDILVGKNLPTGTYILQVRQGNNLQVEKVVKMK